MTKADPDDAMAGQRLLVFGLLGLSWAGLAAAAGALAAGQGGAGLLVWALFLLGAPWPLLSFWNSLIGLLILLLARDPAVLAIPALAAAAADAPITGPVAICVAIRNEDTGRVLDRVHDMTESLAATGWLHRFTFHILSDSSPGSNEAASFQAAAAELQRRYAAPGLLRYRRRATNEGFKAGNLQDFARTEGSTYAVMIVLDADSLMSGPAILRLARVMQACPGIGILQTLVVGRPAHSGFARIFQFGMRHGMRSHTVGAAWWQGPSGPYWGHNAAVRVQPFLAHCAMPVLPGPPPLGGPVLSHDQVEAALMRAAGWEVRVIADECGSWEENPPSLPDFIRRNLRWAQGNLQYVHLLARPGLRPMGRFQLANAVAMFVGPVAWTSMLLTGVAAASWHPRLPALAFGGYLAMIALGFLPRLFGVLHALRHAPTRHSYGGAARLLAGCLLDAVLTLLLLPVTMLSEAMFVAGTLFGRRVVWDAQQRDQRRVSLHEAAAMLWPQTLAGLATAAALASTAPADLIWAAPVVLAWLLSIPLACLSATPSFGDWMRRRRLCAVPEESTADALTQA